MTVGKKEKDSTRAERKVLKRKLENAVPNLPGDADIGQLPNSSTVTVGVRQRLTKKQRRAGTSNDEAAVPTEVRETEGKRLGNGKVRRNRGMQVEQVNHVAQEPSFGGLDTGGISIDEPQKSKYTQRGLNTQREDLKDATDAENAENTARKSKKERRAERKEAVSPRDEANSSRIHVPVGNIPKRAGRNVQTNSGGDVAQINMRHKIKENLDRIEGRAPRFIVFIGNLPFGATTEAIQKHFAAVQPKSVRYLTRKDDPTKSRGCAFMEFDGYDRMKACLKSYHHSSFDDGVSAPRKINVELTVGGGGNKSKRHAKIDEKNQKLKEERTRRVQEEEKAKLAKRGLTSFEHSDIHPSRRARMSEVS